MSTGGAIPAGSSRALRLDPFALPLTFATSDAVADEHIRLVELDRERVILRRTVRGIPMRVARPVSDYLGLAIRVIAPQGRFEGAVAITLEHRDPALSVPLFLARDGSDVVAEWQLWARVLGLPLLIAAGDGRWREAFPRLGKVRVFAPLPRRRRCSPIKHRRPSILLRRKAGCWAGTPVVHRGEREIIARN